MVVFHHLPIHMNLRVEFYSNSKVYETFRKCVTQNSYMF